MKQITYRNRLNGELVVCDNPRETQSIDDVEYLLVRRAGTDRRFLMRKDALERVAKNPQPH